MLPAKVDEMRQLSTRVHRITEHIDRLHGQLGALKTETKPVKLCINDGLRTHYDKHNYGYSSRGYAVNRYSQNSHYEFNEIPMVIDQEQLRAFMRGQIEMQLASLHSELTTVTTALQQIATTYTATAQIEA